MRRGVSIFGGERWSQDLGEIKILGAGYYPSGAGLGSWRARLEASDGRC